MGQTSSIVLGSVGVLRACCLATSPKWTTVVVSDRMNVEICGDGCSPVKAVTWQLLCLWDDRECLKAD